MSATSSGTQVIDCKCKVGQHEYQEKKYGVGKRLANVGAKGDTRCTCCCSTRKSIRRCL